MPIRDALFGDMPFSRLLPASTEKRASEPWISFGHAKDYIDSGEVAKAIVALQNILKMADLESRHYLQAWFFLRGLGVNETQEKAKDILGVIVEVGVKNGVDLIAAFSDHHARYYNFSRAGVVWERPNDMLDGPIDELLRAGKAVV